MRTRRHSLSAACALLCLVALLACAKEGRDERPLQFWHTFNQQESGALHAWLERSNHAVETTVLPFSQAAIRFRDAREHGRCPDLLRIDATRVADFQASGAIAQVPAELWKKRTWLPEAEELVAVGDEHYGLPQSLDGLALIRRRDSAEAPWPPETLSELVELAEAAATRPSFGTQLDGYWFVAFLRSAGGTLPDAQGLPSMPNPPALAALESFASLFRKGLAMDLLEERVPARAMSRAFREGRLAFVFTGPWDLLALSGDELASLEVAPFPGGAAPRGGQVLAVPTCAKNPAAAWKLALDLTAPALQARWAKSLGAIPVTAAALRDSGRLVNDFYRALQPSRLLPRHGRVSELFDDLTPAVAAAVGGDATPSEALGGVGRAWKRLFQIAESPAPGDGQGPAPGDANGDAADAGLALPATSDGGRIDEP